MKRSLLAILTLMLATSALALGAGPASAGTSDQDIADQGIVVAGDVPTGWASEPPSATDTKKNLALAARTKGCADYVKFARANEAVTKAESDDYSSSTGEQISNKSYVHKRAAVATKLMSDFEDSSVPDCLTTVFSKALEARLAKNAEARRLVDSVDFTLDPVDFGDTGGIPTVGYEGTLAINLKDGTSQTSDVGIVAVQVDRVILTYSVQAPPDSTTIEEALGTAVTNTVTRTANAL